ncbi:unnamed protein product, partial [Thlaspi arvense]
MLVLRNVVPQPAHKELMSTAWPFREKGLTSLRSIRVMLFEFNLTTKKRALNGEKINKYNAEELMIIKTQDIKYVFQRWWSEKKEEARELELQTRSRSGDINVISPNSGG